MSPLQITILVIAFVGTDLLVISFVLWSVTGQIRELAGRFPARDASPDAVTRRFQSFRFGSVNLGGSFHVGVDEAFLHLQPTWLARRLAIPAMSIPWDEIRLRDATPRKFKGILGLRATIGTGPGAIDLSGPAWCLEFAEAGKPAPRETL
ncbi:MAG: hypothetical protein AB7Q00_10045 [Phycisphaerales bacterium]